MWPKYHLVVHGRKPVQVIELWLLIKPRENGLTIRQQTSATCGASSPMQTTTCKRGKAPSDFSFGIVYKARLTLYLYRDLEWPVTAEARFNLWLLCRLLTRECHLVHSEINHLICHGRDIIGRPWQHMGKPRACKRLFSPKNIAAYLKAGGTFWSLLIHRYQ